MASNPGSEQLRFGPHTADVEEIIRFVESGGVLGKPFDREMAAEAGFETHLVRSLGNMNRYRKPWVDDALIKRRPWETLKRLDNEEWYYQGMFADREFKNRVRPIFVKERIRFRDLLLRQLATLLPEDEIEIIVDDMEVLMRARTAIGKSDIIHERFFHIYRAGGYPCGWEGAYPRGRLVVFSPYATGPDPATAERQRVQRSSMISLGTKDDKSFVPPYGSGNPAMWRGIVSLEGEYCYAICDEDIDSVGGHLKELYDLPVENMWGDVAGEPLTLPPQCLILLSVGGIDWTYFVAHPAASRFRELVVELSESLESRTAYYRLSGQTKSLVLSLFEFGECIEKLECGQGSAGGIQFESKLRNLDAPHDSTQLRELVDGTFRYHGLCDLMLDKDSLIGAPDKDGLRTVTLRRMPEIEHEIDVLNVTGKTWRSP